jgi:hypothetical protein
MNTRGDRELVSSAGRSWCLLQRATGGGRELGPGAGRRSYTGGGRELGPGAGRRSYTGGGRELGPGAGRNNGCNVLLEIQ